MSIGNQPIKIQLNSHKSTLVIGKNGSGKSTLLEAVSFVLFNKPFRDINKGQLLNSITNKQLVVEIEFEQNSKQYRIIRGIKPNVFEIYLNGELIPPPANVSDYQLMLEEQILKTNHKTFCQVVMLGSAIFVPFMQLKTPQRREVIEDLLDLKVFSIMNVLLKEKVKGIDCEIKEHEHNIQLEEQKISLHKKHMEEINKNNKLVINELQQKIASKEKEIKNLEIQFEEVETRKKTLNSNLGDITKTKQKIDKMNSLYFQLNSEIKNDTKDIRFFNENDVCSVCLQTINKAFKDSIVKEKTEHKKECESATVKIQNQLSELNQNIEKHENQQKEITKLNNKTLELYHDIKTNNGYIKSYNEEISRLKSSEKKTLAEIDIKKTEKALKTLQNEINDLKQEKRTCAFALIMLKDSGIKAKVISQYIPTINQLINKYLSDLDFFVDFNLDENFEETIRSRFRDEFSYNSFSEGQKARIDLALLFTWREISRLRNSFSSNLLILDEIFDGALDIDGIENLNKILSWFDKNSNIFVISHKEGFGDHFDRTINVLLENGFTKMENV